MRGASRFSLLFLALALGAIAHMSCNQALMTAPAGSTIQLVPNPCRISASEGVSVIAAIVMEPKTGTGVADGTVVQFFTDLGTIDRIGKTNDGVARVNLRSDGRSGTATVIAISGGAGGGGSSPSATATPSTQSISPGAPSDRLSADSAGGVRALQTTTSSGGDQCTTPASVGTAQAQIVIGGAAVGNIFVTASPNGIFVGQASVITATVVDSDGNPMANVPVFFTLSGGTGDERLASGGSAVFTDNNGQAFDVVRTSNVGATTTPLTITANAGGKTGNVVINVNP
jgi:hypothetical protein